MIELEPSAPQKMAVAELIKRQQSLLKESFNAYLAGDSAQYHRLNEAWDQLERDYLLIAHQSEE